MGRNIEIKARAGDLASLVTRVAAEADSGPEIICQQDTFFPCADGRLKLRQFADGTGELIAYNRQGGTGPTESRYAISPVDDAGRLLGVLSRALGILGVVRKTRTLYMLGRTRIHLDEVEGLGSFVELEVVLAPDEERDSGLREADEILDRLGIRRADLLDGAYIDMLRPPDEIRATRNPE
jgi:predicted adenylyl cyclase CyaB